MTETVTIENIQQVINKIYRVMDALDSHLGENLSQGAELIQDKAINYLKGVAREPGMSVQGGKITENSSWNIENISNYEVTLKCLSEHAAIVELGGTGNWISTHYGWRGFPIGRQQGKEPPLIRSRVRLQDGHHYLQTTIDSPAVTDAVVNKIKMNMVAEIRSVL